MKCLDRAVSALDDGARTADLLPAGATGIAPIGTDEMTSAVVERLVLPVGGGTPMGDDTATEGADKDKGGEETDGKGER